MNYEAFAHKVFCKPNLEFQYIDRGRPVPEEIFIIDPAEKHPFRDITLSRSYCLEEDYQNASIIEKWLSAKKFVADDTYNRIKFIMIKPSELKSKNPNILGRTIPLDFWFFNQEIKTDTLLFDSLSKKDATLVLMGIEPSQFRHYEKMRDLLTPYTDIDDSGLTWRQKECHFLYQIFLECHGFIENLLNSAVACQEVQSFDADGETRLRLKDVVAWAQSKEIPIPTQLQPLLNGAQRATSNVEAETENNDEELKPFTVKRNVSNVGGPARGKNTRGENDIALSYIKKWRKAKWPEQRIAKELHKRGAGNAVIGYLMADESEDLSGLDNIAAAKRGRRLRGLN